MSNLPQSDWILAGRFVDGDLPTAEAAQAESRIATDAEFAAAVDEIRQQSNLFSQLPTFKPSDDLQQRTLQASVDQVRAIMGVWPPEAAVNPAATTVTKASSDSFDWKSAAALVAALAGVVLIGSMLWPGSLRPGDTGVAMNTAPAATSEKQGAENFKSPGSVDDDISQSKAAPDSPLGEDEFADAALPSPFPSKPGSAFGSEVAKKDLQMRSGVGGGTANKSAQADGIFESGPMFGTPMKETKIAATIANQNAFVNNPLPEQIFCVKQDRNISRETVSQILGLNEIKVQREQAQNSVYSNAEQVEAFYVAATPQQMMLAMSQISNNADIEMIQLPNSGTPIADVIEKQFANSNMAAVRTADDDEAIAEDKAKAPRFRKKESQALAQQLFSNSIPRNFVPLGPAPPILNSDSLIEDFQEEADSDSITAGAFAKSATMNQRPARENLELAIRSRDSKKGIPIEAEEASLPEADEVQSANEKSAMQAPIVRQQRAQKEFADEVQGDLEAEIDEPLRQYLILVRGGEEELIRGTR